MTELGIVVAFTAGLFSVLSPCVLPLFPSYLSFITGMSVGDLTGEPRDLDLDRRQGPHAWGGADGLARTTQIIMTWRWLTPLSALPVLGLLAYGFRVNPSEIPSPLIGQQAAGFALEAFQGKRLSLHSLRRNVVVVSFWASWCYPACYEEAPVFERSWRAYRDRGVTIIGVDIQDTPAAAQKFIPDFGLTFPIGPDPRGRVSIDDGVSGVPETFLLDSQGRVRVKHVGAITDEVFRGHVDRLLAEPG